MKKYLLAYLPPFLWMVFIFFLSSQPNLPGPPTIWADFIFKKLSHMFVYGVLYALFFRAMKMHKRICHTRMGYLLPFCIALAYAVTDEMHQRFVPGRSPTFRDIGYDIIGITTAYLKIKQLI